MATELDAKLSELEAQHGGLVIARTPAGTLAFKRPTQAAFERFQDKMVKGGKESATARELCNSCLVYPTLDESYAVYERFPGLPPKVATQLSEMAGYDCEVEVKGA